MTPLDGDFAPADVIVRDALSGAIERLLATCTDGQRELFSRIWPGGIASIPMDRLSESLGLVQRTVRKNQAGGAA